MVLATPSLVAVLAITVSMTHKQLHPTYIALKTPISLWCVYDGDGLIVGGGSKLICNVRAESLQLYSSSVK